MITIFGVPSAALFGQLLIGLINGSFYALLSLGLAIIFGLLNVVNFAHGALYMLGAFVAWFLGEKAGIDPEQLAGTLGKILFAGAPIPAGYAERIAKTQFEPAAFALPLASLLRDHFVASLAKGREKWDWGGMAAVLRESAGLSPRR